jgi:UrcA family protein
MISKLLAVAVVLASPAAAAAAAAASTVSDSPEPFTVRIPIGDLDLGSDEGRDALRDRAEAAADRTCTRARFPAAHDPESVRACRSRFFEAAREAIASGGRQRMASRSR